MSANKEFTADQLQSGFAAVEGQTLQRCAGLLDRKADGIATDYGKEDPDTGFVEFRKQEVEDRYNELRELADELRAMSRVYQKPAGLPWDDMLRTLRDLDQWLANTGHEETHPWRLSINSARTRAIATHE